MGTALGGRSSAIGFIEVGLVFVARGRVRNLTSAASVTLAAGIGVGAGAGHYELVGLAVLFGVVLLTGVRVAEKLLGSKPRHDAEPQD